MTLCTGRSILGRTISRQDGAIRYLARGLSLATVETMEKPCGGRLYHSSNSTIDGIEMLKSLAGDGFTTLQHLLSASHISALIHKLWPGALLSFVLTMIL